MLKTLLTFIISMLLISSSFAEDEVSGHDTQIEFVEKESGVEPTKVRILLNDEFLRIDAGEDTGDYILFNRLEKVIMNVVHDDQSILTIEYSGLNLPPLTENILIDKTQAPLPDAPKIYEAELKQIVTIVNNQDCKKTVVAVGLLPKVTVAMQELNLVLAEQYAKGLNQRLMFGNEDACEMVVSTYEVNGDLIYGFPVQSTRINGRSRSLVDFKQNIKIDPELFTIPESYQAYWLH